MIVHYDQDKRKDLVFTISVDENSHIEILIDQQPPCGVSWRILPDVGVIVRYADNLKNGTSEIIEEINFKDADDIERIFTDEFKSLDETLRLSLENGGPEIGVITKRE